MAHAQIHNELEMKVVALVAVVALLCLLGEEVAGGKDQELRIGVKKRPETCDMRTKSGDRLSMHYTVKLAPPLSLCWF